MFWGPTGSGQNAQQAADDPTYHPTGNGKRKAPPKSKPYAWIYPPSDGVDTPELTQKLNDVLNFVGYCCEDPKYVPITTPDSARYALLNTLFRSRLYYVTPHHNKTHFGEMVRQGLRYDGWKTIAPYYNYLGENAYTPTELEHVANLAKLGTATQSPPEPSIPVRPIVPPDPGQEPAKPVGTLYKIKHPFTKQELDNYAARNPNNPITQQVTRLYNIPSSSIAAQMYLAADFCCHMITPLTPKDSLRTWVIRIIDELRWQDIKVSDHRDSGDYQDTRQVFEWAFNRKILVFSGLDGGPLPTDLISASALRTYDDLMRKYDADMTAYEQAQKDLRAWKRKYGNRVPPKPAEDETFQILTPVGEEHLAKKRRETELLANAVCLDCKDPNCTCKQLPPPNATVKTDVPPTAVTTGEVKVKTE